MTEEKIKVLETEIKRLRTELDELQECSFKHFKLFTDHLTDQDREIGDIFTYLMPLLKKAYPGYIPTKQHFDAILNRGASRKRDEPGDENT